MHYLTEKKGELEEMKQNAGTGNNGASNPGCFLGPNMYKELRPQYSYKKVSGLYDLFSAIKERRNRLKCLQKCMQDAQPTSLLSPFLSLAIASCCIVQGTPYNKKLVQAHQKKSLFFSSRQRYMRILSCSPITTLHSFPTRFSFSFPN